MAGSGATQHTAFSPLPRASVLQQLRPTPRIFTVMGWLIVGAVTIGAKEVVRWQIIEESVSSELGVGASAAVFSLTIAVVSLMIGRVLDRRDPRPMLLLGYGLAMVGNLTAGLVLLLGPMPLWMILVMSGFDGIVMGIAGIALLKTQAAIVRPGAEGAAEIVNVVRIGIGGALGAVLAGLSPDPAVTMLGSALVLVIALAGLWVALRPVAPRLPTTPLGTSRSLRAYLASAPDLTRILALDLVLALVVPTQLVSLALADLDAAAISGPAIAAGLIGVLVGRLALAAVGFRGSPRAALIAAVTGLSGLLLVSALTLRDGWLLSQPLLLASLVVIGSVCSTYAQGLLAAIIQQQVAEDIRGRLSSIVVAGRYVLITLGTTLGALVAGAFATPVLVIVLACLLLLVATASRGFAAVSPHR